MSKHDFLARQRDMQQGFLEVGEKFGLQKMWDYIQLVLRDPAIMGKDTFGPKRLEKVFEGLKKMADEYQVAFTNDKEADYYQELLDRQLKVIWGDKALCFYDRYPQIKHIKYDKARKGWK